MFVVKPPAMKAENFRAWDQLERRQQTLLSGFWRTEEGAGWWDRFAAEHNDRAAAFLAITGALGRTSVFRVQDADGTALGMVEALTEIRSDRLVVRLRRGAFDEWQRGGGGFTIFLADGNEENGAVEFNGGDASGSLHRGYDVQGYTSACQMPRIHWNYRYADACAEIDLDGYPPTRLEHLTDQNSDVRYWLEAYVVKFGDPGFSVSALPSAPWVQTMRP